MVVVADVSPLRRQGIVDAIALDSRYKVIADSDSYNKLAEILSKMNVDICVISSQLKDMSGYAAIKEIMLSNPKKVLLLTFDDDEEEPDHPEVLDYGIVANVQVSLTENAVSSPKMLAIRLKILSKLSMDRFRIQIEQINQRGKSYLAIKSDKTEISRINRIREATGLKGLLETDADAKPLGRAHSDQIVVLGASTGGPRMLVYIVSQFPPKFPPVLIVQHMPNGFVKQFASRMDKNARVKVKRAEEGDTVKTGHVYIAPGGKHMEIEKEGSLVKIHLTDGPKVNYVKPAVDVTLFAAARVYGKGVISAIFTGMGSDGREGCRVVKKLGGTVLALNEEDSVVYSMNREVIEANLADEVVGMDKMVPAIAKYIK